MEEVILSRWLRRIGVPLAAIAFVLLVVFLGYQWLDAAMSLDNARQGNYLFDGPNLGAYAQRHDLRSQETA